MLFFVIVNSFATTTISLVSNLIRAKQIEKVMPTCRHVITLNYTFDIPLILLALAFSGILLRLFTNEAAVIQTAFYPFCVILSTFIISVPAYTYCNTIIGIGNTKMAFIFQMINMKDMSKGYISNLYKSANYKLFIGEQAIYSPILFSSFCRILLHQCIEKISINLKNKIICTSIMMILKNGWNGYPKN